MVRLIALNVIFALLFVVSTVHAETASRESIMILLNSSGSDSMGMEIAGEILPELRKMLPDVPQSFWDEVKAELSADDLVDEIVAVYQRYLTAEDVRAINQFYLTPAGKKLLSSQPLISQETYRLGEQWGQKVVEQVLQKYQQEVVPPK